MVDNQSLKMVCLSCDSGASVDEDWINTIQYAVDTREFFCLKCDRRWQVK